MAKKTLLKIVQDILSEMSSDEVLDIDDTVEAQQVAAIVESTFFDLIGTRNWPHTRKLVQLEASGSTLLPNYLVLPERLKELVVIKYDKRKLGDADARYEDLTYKYPDEFLKIVSQRKSSDANVVVVSDPSGVELNIIKDKAPTYFTSFDDVHIVTDSFDIAIDTTLKKSKTQCVAYIIPEWDRSNDAIPDMPLEAFPSLIEEAKSTCFFQIKQMANQKSEQKANRQSRWLARKAWRTQGGVRYENYGRK
jgi:hypothetical protein